MTEQSELKLKRRVQIIVITAMSLFFVLVTVVVFQFAIRINQNHQIKSLTKQNATLAEQTQRAQADAKYFDSDEFVRDFAIRFLNRGRPGDKIFL
jgi:cell division protein FtsB